MSSEKSEKSKSSRLNMQISELEEQIKQRRASSNRHLEELQNTVSDNITESQRNFHDKLSAPGSLLTAFGIGFVLDRIGLLRSSNKSEKALEKALIKERRKNARRQQKKAKSTSMLSRLKTTVTLVTATAAVLSRLDDYMDKVNKKSAELVRSGTTAAPRQNTGEYTASTPSPGPAVSPDNSGQARP